MKPKATRQAYGEALVKLGEANDNVIVLDADLCKSTMTNSFKDTFPDRFFDMGISECDMVGTAAGLATTGKTVFASSFAVFASGRAWEQIRNTVAYSSLNVIIGATHAGISVGADGPSHQSIEDIGLMRVLPGMTVLSPADAIETEQCVFAAAECDGPVYLRLGRAPVPNIYDENYKFEIGKASVLADGSDVTIVATAGLVGPAIEAVEELKKDGINARLLNIASIKPLDEAAIIAAAKETAGIVVAEEHSVMCGLGSAVAEVTSTSAPCVVTRLGMQDCFGQSGPPEALMEIYGLTTKDIVESCKNILDNA